MLKSSSLTSFSKLPDFLTALARNSFAKFMFLLALGSTAATYIASIFPRFRFPWWIAALCAFIAFFWGSFDLYLAKTREIAQLSLEKAERERALQQQIADLADGVELRQRRILVEVIGELDSNLLIAQHPHSGMPGNRIYLPPTVDVWRNQRHNLGFLNDEIRADLDSAYRLTERWHGIVAGGRARPDIGNREIDEITATLRAGLPGILQRLRGANPD
jgi:hypothetical protein